MAGPGRVGGSPASRAPVSGARDRRRASTSAFWDSIEERESPDDRPRHRNHVRIDGVTFDRNAPRGTYLNIVV
ncbi:hypothetical protein C882_4492 [Caenispirillum salinarum AK4]|uniref:Uncharacterized protein n=1 Tax=Caenispirillum salinarum AK4 TaxID=1238182 RepID=K9HJJ0_9PROT|nr:hypothetical protein [Caenispirillum salinarum]EKV30533.1 hypothetical protein C882_4492 [Caenispirillum salinarum AK4]